MCNNAETCQFSSHSLNLQYKFIASSSIKNDAERKKLQYRRLRKNRKTASYGNQELDVIESIELVQQETNDDKKTGSNSIFKKGDFRKMLNSLNMDMDINKTNSSKLDLGDSNQAFLHDFEMKKQISADLPDSQFDKASCIACAIF